MKNKFFKYLPVLIVALWAMALVVGELQAQQKAVKFVDYNANSVSKPACFGATATSFATFTACTDMTTSGTLSATGLTTSGTVTAASAAVTGAVTAGSAVLTTPLPVASGGTGTNTRYTSSIATAPTYTGQMAITGGNAYIATAVTGTVDDWLQINN